METETKEDTSRSGEVKDGSKQPKERIRDLNALLTSVEPGQWDALDLPFAPTGVPPTGFLDEREKQALVLLKRFEDEDFSITGRAIKAAGEHIECHGKDLQGQGEVLPHDCADFRKKLGALKEEHEQVAAAHRHLDRILTTKLAFEFGLRGSGDFVFFKDGSFIFTPSEPKSRDSSSDADPSELPPEVAETIRDVIENLPKGTKLAEPIRVTNIKLPSGRVDLGAILTELLGRKPND